MIKLLRRTALAAAIAALSASVNTTTTTNCNASCDSTYAANHPRLLFSQSDIPALQSKIGDGGYDADAFAWLRYLADDFFPVVPMGSKLRQDFGRWAVMSLGTAAYLHTPFDTASVLTAREVTLEVVDNYDVDLDEASSSSRLQTLAFGYDMFFDACDDSLRTAVRDEMISYLQTMVYSNGYELFTYRPYLANHSAMVAAAVGIAGIVLEDEADPVLLADAIDFADAIVESLLTHQFDPGGSYKEGVNYAGWTMRHLIYYFHARKNYDGFDYALDDRIRKVEEWLPYEILPHGYGLPNNMNDSMSHNFPLSMHTTYLDWAQSAWSSGLMAYVFEHTASPWGLHGGVNADKVGTVLWNQALTPTQPGDVLPPSRLWLDRGLYYYRTGWPIENTSEDVVFSFFSGKFHGGHAQEDQNQFTLHAYGGRFAIDHGAGQPAAESEAHNMVLIDGQGQHGTGGSIGTDGRISEHVLNDFGDYLVGDATLAYATYSPFNAPDHPVEGTDWSWGYEPGNPVLHARRGVVVVHEAETPPYFIVTDDIDKDGGVHTYKWRLHTDEANTIDTGGDPIRINDGTSYLDILSLGDPLQNLTTSESAFDNTSGEPNASVLNIALNAVNPYFGFLLLPGKNGVAKPAVTQSFEAWGSLTELDWGGRTDYVVHNHSGGSVTVELDAIDRPGSHRDFEDAARTVSVQTLETDAYLTVIRDDGNADQYLAAGAASVSFRGRLLVAVSDGPVNVASNGVTVDVDRGEADFLFYAPAAAQVRADGQPIAFTVSGDYVTPGSGQPAPSAATPARPPSVRAFPNPFRDTVHLIVEIDETANVDAFVYDVGGRRVAALFEGRLSRGEHDIVWSGRRDDGTRAATGIYFMRVNVGEQRMIRKISLIR